MPKERIKHGALFINPKDDTKEPSRPFTPNEKMKSGETLHEESSLEVNWRATDHIDGYVQLSIHATRSWWERLMNSHSEENSPGTVAWGAYVDSLSRQEINNLIKVLRRARDAVYGSDE